jgi:putative transposase
MKQLQFQKTHWKHQFSHGGTLRNQRAGRRFRPLSGKEPVHLVLKANKQCLKSGLRTYKRFFLIQSLVQKYSYKFFVKVEQISVQGDHIHLLIRASRRSNYQSFFRVLSGQIAQQFQKQSLMMAQAEVTDTPKSPAKLWKHRPFSRVVRGWRAYRILRDYIQLNEKEALGEICYQKRRLRDLSTQEWQGLWC